MKHLFLDDTRNPEDVIWVNLPKNVEWDIVRNYRQFCLYLEENGVPDFISFDFNLGDSLDGYQCANYLVAKVTQKKLKWNPNFKFEVHSSDSLAVKKTSDFLNQHIKLFNRLED